MREAARERLLDSLRDPEMNARRNQIEKAHFKTFSWVFGERSNTSDSSGSSAVSDSEDEDAEDVDENENDDEGAAEDPEDSDIKDGISSTTSGDSYYFDRSVMPWDSFTDWLSSPSPSPPYWISGKAGSGKSTFMKFLINNPRTTKHLNKWAPKCVIYSHFIWSSGTPNQRSVRGLLRSLLFQIFQGYDVLPEMILEELGLSRIQYCDDWSRELLETTIFRFLSTHEQPVCIFVDGLDEIDQKEGIFDLMDLVKGISSIQVSKGVKICVSSRPETSFMSSLNQCPKLRLQDLTWNDIRSYTKNFLRTKCSLGLEVINAEDNDFVYKITEKADGVFLWVSLALKSLQRGFTNGDNSQKLAERLEQLPSELANLYEDMLKRNGEDEKVYKEEATLAFNIMLLLADSPRAKVYSGQYFDIFTFAVMWNPRLAQIILEQKSSCYPARLKSELVDTARQLNSRCAGLLEFTTQENEDFADHLAIETRKRPWEGFNIQFIHRSANDFLRSSQGNFLNLEEPSVEELNFRLIQALALRTLFISRSQSLTALTDLILTLRERGPILRLTSSGADKLLTLIHELWQGAKHPGFYECTAKNGFHRFHDSLLRRWPRPQQPLLNYFFEYAVRNSWENEATVLHFLEMGADPKWTGLQRIYFLGHNPLYFCIRPFLAEYFVARFINLYDPSDSSPDFFADGDWLLSFFKLPMDFQKTFLLERPINIARSIPDNTDWEIKSGSPRFITFVIETNLVGILPYISNRHIQGSVLATMLQNQWNIQTLEAHYKVLLYEYENTFYSQEDAQISKELLSLVDASCNGQWVFNINETLFLKIVEQLVSAKPVIDFKQWFADRGHLIVYVDDEDFTWWEYYDEIPLEEKVARGQRLNERAKKLWEEKRGSVDENLDLDTIISL